MVAKRGNRRAGLKFLKMEHLGARLKKIRFEKGISLEEVQKKTKIHLNILKAIEGDSLTNLSPVYLKGFLKIYCKFLGLDPKDYVADYKEPLQSQVANVILPKKSTALLKVATVRLVTLQAINKKVKRLFVFILIIIIISAVLFNLGKFISSKRRAGIPEGKPAKIQQSSQKVTKSTPVITPIKKETASGIRLGIRASENCWVSLKVDGRLVFQRVLEKGRFKSWQAKDRIELSLGNAGAIELEVNGQLFSNLGRRGQVRKNIVITKEGLDIGR